MTRILIVDDHPGVSAMLQQLFGRVPGLIVCGTAESGEGGLALATSLKPDVVIMDNAMPGMGGIEATRAIIGAGVACQVLMLSGHWTADQVVAAKEAGACDTILKGGRVEDLLSAVRAVAAGGSPHGGAVV